MSKSYEDLTGQVFGHLTVQELSENRNGLYYWKCICDCGNTKIASIRRLKAGTCTHCGCQNKGGKDLTGQVFGDLTVQEFVKKKDGHYYWKCICSCGKTKITTEYSLITGNCKSCGCLVTRKFIKDLIGQKFGRLTVLYKGENDKTRHIRWVCQCDCGNITTVYKDALLDGRQISCGCYLKEVKHQRTGEKSPNKKYNQYDLSGEYGIGWTYNTNKEFYFDIEDYEKIKNYCWREDSNGYIVTNESRENFNNINKRPPVILLHRLIMGLNDNSNKDVDHIFHKTYDNRKSQLRVTTHSNNLKNHKVTKRNTSGVTGVCFITKEQKYFAYIHVNKHRISLGYYSKFEDAVKARKEAEEKYFREYAYKKEE